ncbi:hypothetical protein THRCLA_20751 [Thraustotheca clavata]|uniref:Uncharacterized protein n=1 Tax=Thraustotheca clavata TaxID=74557 RepID=A0A1W0A3Y1_9STRA|nr:hypothetical protein THRCLA_20751 [Thraustotheca clavata]
MSGPKSCSSVCCFRDCTAPAIGTTMKCHYHRNRAKCRVPACLNQVYARQLCVGHGGRRKCEFPNCESNARLGQYCTLHSKKIKQDKKNETKQWKENESAFVIDENDLRPFELHQIYEKEIDPLDYAILESLL